MGLSALFQAIKDVRTVAALKIHLESAIKEAEELKKKAVSLEAENVELLRENRELRHRLEQISTVPEYFDAGICRFKKMPDGKFGPTPYCANCDAPLSEAKTNKIWLCTKCQNPYKHQEILKARRSIP